MTSKPRLTHRWAGASLVAVVSTLTLGLPMAATANAAATAVQATPAQSAYAVGDTAIINVTTTGTPTQLSYTIVAGPGTTDGAAATFPNAVACGSDTECDVTNNGTAGTDTIRVFDDTNTDNKYTAGEPFQDVTVTFTGAPTSVALSPDAPTDVVNQCQPYTVTANDAQGRPAADWPITITATQNNVSGYNAVGPVYGTSPQFCDPTTGATLGTQNHTGSNGNAVSGTNTDTNTKTVTTGANGTATFGVLGTQAGTITVKAQYGSGASDTSTQTVVGGQTGNAAVKSLSVQPTSTNQYTGTSVTYTVTARDANGNPVSGADVSYDITSGPDATAANQPNAGGAPACNTTTTPNGTAQCTITNNGTAGTDHIVFYVNNGTGTTTTGPDAGEPQASADATFTAPPAFDTGNSSVTCADQTNNGQASNNCVVPTTQKSVTFTAHVADSNNAPVSGAVVSWTAGSSSDTVTPTSGTSTTNANGDATFTVTDATPTDGNVITVTAKIGNATVGSATATYETPSASQGTFTLKPPLQTVTNGGTVTVVATVVDQFGNGVAGQTITYAVTGRNSGKTGTVTTGANGSAVISYTDTAVVPSATTDQITATDTSANAPSQNQAQANVQFIAGSTTAATVTVNTANGGNSSATPSTCPSTAGSNSNTSGTIGNHFQVCAHVANSDGTALAGKTVTFTVDKGTVSTTGTANSTSGTTATATTDAYGNAYASVFSTTSGTQTVTAKADSATGTGTITYGQPSQCTFQALGSSEGDTACARNVSIAPSTVPVPSGTQQKFTATVVDVYGNPLPGIDVTFNQSGPGNLGGTSSSTTAKTDANGQASATLTTAASDAGNGSVTVTIQNPGIFGGTQECTYPAGQSNRDASAAKTAGNCSATANYSVSPAAPPADNIAITSFTAPASHTVGGTWVFHIHTTTPNANYSLFKKEVGHGWAVIQSGTTDASGNATVSTSFDYRAYVLARHTRSDDTWAFSSTLLMAPVHQYVHLTGAYLKSAKSASRPLYAIIGTSKGRVPNEVFTAYNILPNGKLWRLGTGTSNSTGGFLIRPALTKGVHYHITVLGSGVNSANNYRWLDSGFAVNPISFTAQ